MSYEEYNFYASLSELPIELIRLDVIELSERYGKAVMSKVVKETVLRERPDALIYFHYKDVLDHSMLAEFKTEHKEMETIIWLCDDDVRYEEYKELVLLFNKVVTTIGHRHEQRKKLGIDSYYSQFLANTSLFRPLGLAKKYDAVFIGQKFGNRPELVEHLRSHGIDVQTWGPFWRSDSRLSQMEMIEVINRARIMLNFSSSSKDATKKFIKGRVFEIIACGSFLLTEECDDLDTYLVDGKDLVTFKDKDDMLRKAKQYLADEKARETIAARGAKTVRDKYSFQKEFAKILGV